MYDELGEGPSVLLLHGFAANATVNWEKPGVAGSIAEQGYRVLVPDLRGHGRSGAPHDLELYRAECFVSDVSAILDHAELTAAVLVGYSLGARVALLASMSEERAVATVLAGTGRESLGGRSASEELIARALEAETPEEITDRTGRAFRGFADATRSDRLALANVMRALRLWPQPELSRLETPALVLAGDLDTRAGDPSELAALLGDGASAVVKGNHMNAMLDPDFSMHIVQFLRQLGSW